MIWHKQLQNLSLSPKKKGYIIQKLYSAEWGEETIQTFFDTCVQCGGEEALISALQGLLHGTDGGVKKKVQIFTPEVQDEEVVFAGKWWNMSESFFNSLVPARGVLCPFKGEQLDKSGDTILQFQDLVQGESYFLEDFSGVPKRLRALENFNNTEMQTCEQELAMSMVQELKAHGIAQDPIIRNDLRIHCRGTPQEQEFDAILLDGNHHAFIGSEKHVAHGTSEVEDMLCKVRILADRARDIKRYPSYVAFQGRALGCCMRIDTIKESHQEAVKHLCFRKGVGLFQRSGDALVMQHFSFTGAQSLDPGFINMMVRGIKRLVR